MEKHLVPTDINGFLTARVLGQSDLLRRISVSLYKHINFLPAPNVLLIGNSGTGKTTLMQAISGFYDAYEALARFRVMTLSSGTSSFLATASMMRRLAWCGTNRSMSPRFRPFAVRISSHTAVMPPQTSPEMVQPAIPVIPPPGIEKMMLQTYCKEYNLPLSTAVQRLAKHNITAFGDMTFEELSLENNRTPTDILRLITGP